MAQQQPRSSEGISFAGGFNLVWLALSGYAACFWPFTRCRFGTDMPGTYGLAAIGVMWMTALCFHCPEMSFFFAVWLVLVVFHRIEALSRGRNRYSHDDGWPWLAYCIWPRPVNEFIAKSTYEAFIVVLAGALLCPWSQRLGGFVMLGCVPIMLKASFERIMIEGRIRKMRNAQMSMQGYFDLYKRRYPANRR